MRESLVSSRTLRERLKVLEEEVRAEAPFNADFVTRREERLLLEFRRLLKEAEIEYVSTGAAAELTGWDAATLRKYARRALAADPLPEEWSELVVRRGGKEYELVLASIPPKPRRSAA